jgi:hypothetical protein
MVTIMIVTCLYERIGEERTFELDLIPASLVKREIVRLTCPPKTGVA